jgi:hypothetical protein
MEGRRLLRNCPSWLIAGAAVLAVSGCGKKEKAGQVRPMAEARPAPYTYRAPVKGRIHEINIGRFELVDGVAYTTGAGTVVFASSRPIASPAVADSPCPMTEARSLELLRDASWAEVTIEESGRSKYFAYGTAFGGSGFDKTGGTEWAIQVAHTSGDRIKGTAFHRSYGGFEFELPVTQPRFREVSEMDRSDGRRSDPAAPLPTEAAVTATYGAVRDSALSGNLKGVLAAQGFGEKTTAAIRGLDGIDGDLAVYADRFLRPGDPTPGEFTAKPGTAYVRVEGANSKGKKFANYYHFNSCGDRLILVSIRVNPQ